MRQLGYIFNGELIGADGVILTAPPSRALAVIEDTADHGPVTVTQSEPERAVVTKAAPTIDSDPIEEIAALLAKLTRIVQTLDADDARRARELVSAASSLLAASTRLPDRDQRLFEQALRTA